MQYNAMSITEAGLYFRLIKEINKHKTEINSNMKLFYTSDLKRLSSIQINKII